MQPLQAAATPPTLTRSLLWRRIAGFALLFMLIVALASSSTLHRALLDALAAVNDLIDAHPVRGAVLFASLAAASAMLAFMSISIAVPAAVYAWGEPLSILLLWSGWMIGGVAAYALARFLGRPIMRRLIDDALLARMESRVHRDTPFASIVLFQLALPSEIPGYVLGVVRYPLHKYLGALALGELPYALASVYLGAGFVEARVGYVLTVLLCLAALSIGAVLILRRQMHAAPTAEAPEPPPGRAARFP